MGVDAGGVEVRGAWATTAASDGNLWGVEVMACPAVLPPTREESCSHCATPLCRNLSLCCTPFLFLVCHIVLPICHALCTVMPFVLYLIPPHRLSLMEQQRQASVQYPTSYFPDVLVLPTYTVICLVLPCRLSLVGQQRQASSLVRGLAGGQERPGEAAGPSASGSVGPLTPVGLCLATPDGLPVVGFHPGFEAGRVVVAFSASATSLPSSPLPHQSNTEGGTSEGGGGAAVTRDRSDRDKRNTAEREGRQRAAILPQQDGQAINDDGSGPAPIASALGDGFQLNPLLAKAAADLLIEGCTHLNLPISDALSLSRSGLVADGTRLPSGGGQAAIAAKGVDSWGELARLQDGSVHRYRSPEEVEREADEREDLRRAMAG